MRDQQVLTVEQYLALPDDERFFDDVSRGRVVREPRPGFEHGRIVVRMATMLAGYLEQQPVGKIVTETGFVLSTSPLTIRGPDLSFVRNERVRESPTGFLEGAPDLAIEVVSDSNRPGALLTKIAELLEAGAQAVWVIYPRPRRVVVHAAHGDVAIHDTDSTLSAGELLPGFALRVADLFE
jgi:Uma2 family endonuclease